MCIVGQVRRDAHLAWTQWPERDGLVNQPAAVTSPTSGDRRDGGFYGRSTCTRVRALKWGPASPEMQASRGAEISLAAPLNNAYLGKAENPGDALETACQQRDISV